MKSKVIKFMIFLFMVFLFTTTIKAETLNLLYSSLNNLKATDNSMNITLKRNEQQNIVEVKISDSTSKINSAKVTKGYILASNVDIFNGLTQEVRSLEFTSSNEVFVTFPIYDGLGAYTVYATNEKGEGILGRITLKEKNPPLIEVLANEGNYRKIKINVTDESAISKLKIARKQGNEEIDFESQGENLLVATQNKISIEYTANEDGVFVIYAQDEAGNSSEKTVTIYNEFPITAKVIQENDSSRKVKIEVEDKIGIITEIKYAKKSEISSIDDFESLGNMIDSPSSPEIIVDFEFPEDGVYYIYVEDNFGLKKMVEKRISSDLPMSINITQSSENKKRIEIIAEDKFSDIVEMKILIGDNVTVENFKQNGENLIDNKLKKLTYIYEMQNNGKINVYIKDEDGYWYMYSKTIIGIDEPSKDVLPPKIQLIQKENTIYVKVQDSDSYIRRVKMEKGSKTVDYFVSNGKVIGEGSVGKIIEAEVPITEVGIYTFYAEDNEQNKVVEEINIKELNYKEEIIIKDYEQKENIISQIKPNTKLEEFKQKIEATSQYEICNSNGEKVENGVVGTGMKIKTQNKEYELVVEGDTNGDGRISLIDASKIKMQLVNLKRLEGAYLKAADLNGDGRVSLLDCSLIKKILVGLL